jgi:hypothetical protein
MRLLSPEQQEGILQALRRDIPTANLFSFQPENLQIITGQMEGVYGWIALNYALKRFAAHSTQAVPDTAGLIEIGGASSQMAFQVPSSLELPDELSYVVDLDLGCRSSSSRSLSLSLLFLLLLLSPFFLFLPFSQPFLSRSLCRLTGRGLLRPRPVLSVTLALLLLLITTPRLLALPTTTNSMSIRFWVTAPTTLANAIWTR